MHPCRTRFPASATAISEGWHMRCSTSEASPRGFMTHSTHLWVTAPFFISFFLLMMRSLPGAPYLHISLQDKKREGGITNFSFSFHTDAPISHCCSTVLKFYYVWGGQWSQIPNWWALAKMSSSSAVVEPESFWWVLSFQLGLEKFTTARGN